MNDAEDWASRKPRVEPAAQAGVSGPGVRRTAGRVAVAEPAPMVETGPPGVVVPVDGSPTSSMQAPRRSESVSAATMVIAFIDRHGSRRGHRRQRIEARWVAPKDACPENLVDAQSRRLNGSGAAPGYRGCGPGGEPLRGPRRRPRAPRRRAAPFPPSAPARRRPRGRPSSSHPRPTHQPAPPTPPWASWRPSPTHRSRYTARLSCPPVSS